MADFTKSKINYFSGPVKVRALKNATANETTTQSTAERKKGGGLGGEKTLLRQRVKEMNDTTSIDCSIVMHAPRGGIL